MAKRLILLFLVFSLPLAACGDDDETPDTGSVPTDAAREDAASLSDAGNHDTAASDAPRFDAAAQDGALSDVGVVDVGVADGDVPDTSSADGGVVDLGVTDSGTDSSSGLCPVRVEDRLAGACDGRGMAICRRWATEHGGETATATCVRPEGRCARADSCREGECRCGDGPECAADQMCVSGFAGFSCVCARE